MQLTATATRRLRLDPRVMRGGTFRVLVGVHIDFGPPGCTCLDCHESGGREHVYEATEAFERRTERDAPEIPAEKRAELVAAHANDLVTSKRDLVVLLGPEKFARLTDASLPAPDVVRGEPPALPLEDLKLQQLYAVAEDEGVDLGGATRKADVIEAIRRARG